MAFAGPTHDFMLNNGLKVDCEGRPSGACCGLASMVQGGSSYEHGGITGLSHALEHMMFKGTQHYPAGNFKDHVSECAVDNASTSDDYTFYYQELAADKLPLSFALEADRMQNLTLKPEEFTKKFKL